MLTSTKLKNLMAEHRLNVKKVASMVRVTPTCVYRWLKEGTDKGRVMPERAMDLLQLRLAQPSGKVLRLGDTWGIR